MKKFCTVQHRQWISGGGGGALLVLQRLILMNHCKPAVLCTVQ